MCSDVVMLHGNSPKVSVLPSKAQSVKMFRKVETRFSVSVVRFSFAVTNFL
jgi:hypothetical protein